MRSQLLCVVLAIGLGCASPAPEPSPAVNARLVGLGYRPKLYQGHLLYCRDEAVTGSQFKDLVCRSEAEVEQLGVDTREAAQSRAMHPNLQCTPRTCAPP